MHAAAGIRAAVRLLLAVSMLTALPMQPAWAADPPVQPPIQSSAGTSANPANGNGNGNGAPSPQLRREDANWELSADLDLQLSASLESALQRGVPLYFTLRFAVTRPRWYWLDAELVDIRREYRVSYHALTRQYRVSTGALALSYPTLGEAMRAVTSLRGFAVAETARFRPGERYRARLELRLDGSRLPKPLQINLIGPGDWSSDVEAEWEFMP